MVYNSLSKDTHSIKRNRLVNSALIKFNQPVKHAILEEQIPENEAWD